MRGREALALRGLRPAAARDGREPVGDEPVGGGVNVGDGDSVGARLWPVGGEVRKQRAHDGRRGGGRRRAGAEQVREQQLLGAWRQSCAEMLDDQQLQLNAPAALLLRRRGLHQSTNTCTVKGVTNAFIVDTSRSTSTQN